MCDERFHECFHCQGTGHGFSGPCGSCDGRGERPAARLVDEGDRYGDSDAGGVEHLAGDYGAAVEA